MTKETEKNPQVEELFTNPEPWEQWESKLVVWSITIAIIGLAILGVLINWLIL
jgi:cytochrome b561